MSRALRPSGGARPRIIVAGAGVAGLEGLIALRELAGERIELELIAPEREFEYRPLAVLATFGEAPRTAIDVASIAGAVGAHVVEDAVTAVDPARRSVVLRSGAPRPYDGLLLAPGARAVEAVPGAITFGVPGGGARVRAVLAAAESGRMHRLVFAVPAGTGWPLALYELALMSARRLRDAGSATEVALVTPEAAPLEVFGGRASGAVLSDLERTGIAFHPGMAPESLAWGELRLSPGWAAIAADSVIALAAHRGPALAGVPADRRGFVPVDAHGLVRGLAGVYAAGDATTFPIKQGGLAAQQAQAAAEALAAEAGAPIAPAPFRPVLRGVLLTGEQPRYLEAAVGSGGGGRMSEDALWWPPAKLAGRHLAPYLAGLGLDPHSAPPGMSVDVEVAPARGGDPSARGALR